MKTKAIVSMRNYKMLEYLMTILIKPHRETSEAKGLGGFIVVFKSYFVVSKAFLRP